MSAVWVYFFRKQYNALCNYIFFWPAEGTAILFDWGEQNWILLQNMNFVMSFIAALSRIEAPDLTASVPCWNWRTLPLSFGSMLGVLKHDVLQESA